MKKIDIVERMKAYLELYYKELGNAENYYEEEAIDKEIHRIKKELGGYGIYVQEKIKPKYIKK